MNTYTIIVSATGQIHSIISVSDDSFVAMNTPAGCESVPGAPANPASYWDDVQWVSIPAQPDPNQTWNPSTRTWGDVRALADVLADTTAALVAAYEVAIAQPVPYTSTAGVAQVFQADPQSLFNLSSSMLGCQASQTTPTGFYWVALDNTHVPFTFADLQGLAALIFSQGSTCFAKLQQLKTAARAATSNTALDGITWTSVS